MKKPRYEPRHVGETPATPPRDSYAYAVYRQLVKLAKERGAHLILPMKSVERTRRRLLREWMNVFNAEARKGSPAAVTALKIVEAEGAWYKWLEHDPEMIAYMEKFEREHPDVFETTPEQEKKWQDAARELGKELELFRRGRRQKLN